MQFFPNFYPLSKILNLNCMLIFQFDSLHELFSLISPAENYASSLHIVHEELFFYLKSASLHYFLLFLVLKLFYLKLMNIPLFLMSLSASVPSYECLHWSFLVSGNISLLEIISAALYMELISFTGCTLMRTGRVQLQTLLRMRGW